MMDTELQNSVDDLVDDIQAIRGLRFLLSDAGELPTADDARYIESLVARATVRLDSIRSCVIGRFIDGTARR